VAVAARGNPAEYGRVLYRCRPQNPAHFLGRALRIQGHDARLMPAQFVRAFRKSNKNDYLDAEAISEAVQRPTIRFVPIKPDDQLDLHGTASGSRSLVARRTAVMNQIRNFLVERGITIRRGPSHLASQLPLILEDAALPLSHRIRLLILELKHEWNELEKRIEAANSELEKIAKEDDACHRLMEIAGFGPLVSTLWLRPSETPSHSAEVEIFLPGWGLFLDNAQPAGRPNCSVSASAGMNIYAGCSYMEHGRLFYRSSGTAPLLGYG